MSIDDNGELHAETIGNKKEVELDIRDNSLYPSFISSHSHPIGKTKYGVYFGCSGMSESDLCSNKGVGEERVFMRHPIGNKKVHGELHSISNNYPISDKERENFLSEYDKSQGTIYKRNFDKKCTRTPGSFRDQRDISVIKKCLAAHNQTASNAATIAPFMRKYYRLHVEKGEEPDEYYITKIRESSKEPPEEPDYSVASLLRRKRKKKIKARRITKKCICKPRKRK